MFRFKHSNNSLTDYIELDGYAIADALLENVMIEIFFDQQNNIQARFKVEDLPCLKGLDLAHYLDLAQQLSHNYINTRQFEQFSLARHTYLLDIINEKNISYYHQNIPYIKETIYLKMQPICIEALLERMEKTNNLHTSFIL